MFLLIDDNVINEALSQMNWSDQNISLIFTNYGEVVNANKKIGFSEHIFNAINSTGEICINFTYQKKHYVLTHVQSDNGQWHYATLLPTDIYLNTINRIKRNSILIMIVCNLLIIFITIYGIKNNYSPLLHFMKLITSKLNLESKAQKDEYTYIETALNEAITDREKLNNDVIKYRQRQQNDLLIYKLITGRISNPKSKNLDFLNKTDLNNGYFVIININLEDGPGNANMEDPEQCHNVIDQIKEEFDRDPTLINDYYFYELHPYKYVILVYHNADNLEGDHKQLFGFRELEELCQRVLDLLSNNVYGFNGCIAISDSCATIDKINPLYLNTERALQYSAILKKKIICYDDILEMEKNDSHQFLTLEEQKKLLNHVYSRETTAATQMVQRKIDELQNMDNVSINSIKSLLYSIHNVLFNIIEDMNLEYENIEEIKEIDDYIINSTSIEYPRINELVDSAIKKVVEVLGSEDAETELINHVIHNIEVNHHKLELNVSCIADRLDINISTLSKAFKRHTGKGIHEYITQTRLTYAKKLLRKSDLKLEEISHKTGFLDSNALIRTFKKYEGITPGKYRKLNSMHRNFK